MAPSHQGWPLLALSVLCLGVGVGGSLPMASILAVETLPQEARGAAMNTLGLLFASAGTMVPVGRKRKAWDFTPKSGGLVSVLAIGRKTTSAATVVSVACQAFAEPCFALSAPAFYTHVLRSHPCAHSSKIHARQV